MRILVVDDEKIKRVTLADDLAGEGHEVVTAADGQQAADLLDREVFDVVITDLKMPRIDGMELLKRLKANPEHEDVAVILMTAYGSIPVAVEAMKLGAFDFVTKPFRNEDVFPLIRRIEAQRGEDDAGTSTAVEPTGLERRRLTNWTDR
jgi:two-component system, NtrC family, response regulator PilR